MLTRDLTTPILLLETFWGFRARWRGISDFVLLLLWCPLKIRLWLGLHWLGYAVFCRCLRALLCLKKFSTLLRITVLFPILFWSYCFEVGKTYPKIWLSGCLKLIQEKRILLSLLFLNSLKCSFVVFFKSDDRVFCQFFRFFFASRINWSRQLFNDVGCVFIKDEPSGTVLDITGEFRAAIFQSFLVCARSFLRSMSCSSLQSLPIDWSIKINSFLKLVVS